MVGVNEEVQMHVWRFFLLFEAFQKFLKKTKFDVWEREALGFI